MKVVTTVHVVSGVLPHRRAESSASKKTKSDPQDPHGLDPPRPSVPSARWVGSRPGLWPPGEKPPFKFCDHDGMFSYPALLSELQVMSTRGQQPQQSSHVGGCFHSRGGAVQLGIPVSLPGHPKDVRERPMCICASRLCGPTETWPPCPRGNTSRRDTLQLGPPEVTVGSLSPRCFCDHRLLRSGWFSDSHIPPFASSWI